MQVQAGATTLTLPPDYGVWIPPGCVHTLWIGEEVELESLYIEPTAVAIQDQEPRVVMVDEFVRAFIHHGCTSIPVMYDEDGADGRKVKVLLDSLQSLDRQSTSLNSSHQCDYRMASSDCKKQNNKT